MLADICFGRDTYLDLFRHCYWKYYIMAIKYCKMYDNTVLRILRVENKYSQSQWWDTDRVVNISDSHPVPGGKEPLKCAYWKLAQNWHQSLSLCHFKQQKLGGRRVLFQHPLQLGLAVWSISQRHCIRESLLGTWKVTLFFRCSSQWKCLEKQDSVYSPRQGVWKQEAYVVLFVVLLMA